jgi:hypothetical protein
MDTTYETALEQANVILRYFLGKVASTAVTNFCPKEKLSRFWESSTCADITWDAAI